MWLWENSLTPPSLSVLILKWIPQDPRVIAKTEPDHGLSSAICRGSLQLTSIVIIIFKVCIPIFHSFFVFSLIFFFLELWNTLMEFRGRVFGIVVKMPLGMPASYVRVTGFSSSSFASNKLPADTHSWRQKMMAQLLWFLPSTWEIRIKCHDPIFRLTQSWLLWAFGNQGMEDLCLSVSLLFK